MEYAVSDVGLVRLQSWIDSKIDRGIRPSLPSSLVFALGPHLLAVTLVVFLSVAVVVAMGAVNWPSISTESTAALKRSRSGPVCDLSLCEPPVIPRASILKAHLVFKVP